MTNTFPWGERTMGFMASCAEYQQAVVALLGVPMDFTVSFRPGARMGPQQIREMSYVLEEYSLPLKRELAQVPFFDCGDLNLPWGNVVKSLDLIRQAVGGLLSDGKLPILLGGEHLITLPAVQATLENYPDLAVLQLDAHADLRSDYEGEGYSHATVMWQVSSLIGPGNLYQVGIRSGTKEEFAYARENTNMWFDGLYPELVQALEQVGPRPLYVTLDIDVVDPAYAPGTGTPEPGGWTAREFLAGLPLLKERQVVAIDVVEVAPAYDPGQITALLAAKTVRELILGCGHSWGKRVEEAR